MSSRSRCFCAVFCTYFLSFSTFAQPPGGDEPRKSQSSDNVKPATDAFGDTVPEGAKMRLGSTRFRFGGNVSTAALSPDGKVMAIGTGSDLIILADPVTGKETAKMRIAGGYGVQNLVFSPNGKVLGVLGYGPGIRLVEVPSGKQIAQLQNQQPNMRSMSMSFSGDGKSVSASVENFNQNQFHVHVWEAATGKEIAKVGVLQNNQIKSALTSDGSILATWGFYSPRGPELNPDQGRTIQLWNVKDGKEKHKIKIDRQNISSVAFAPDGKTFAVASGVASFHIFDTDSAKELRKFAGRRGQVTHLDYTRDGLTLVAGAADGTVQTWEAKTGKRQGLCEGSQWHRLFALAFPDDGKVLSLVSQGQALELRDGLTGKSLAPPLGHHYWVRSLAYSTDGKTLVSAGADGKICWWDSATGKELKSLVVQDDGNSPYGGAMYKSYYPGGMPGRIGTSAISRDGKFLATGNDYGTNSVRLWDLSTAKVLCDFDAVRTNGPSCFAFSPDGGRLAALGTNGVPLWEVNSGQEMPTLKFERDAKVNNTVGGSVGGSIVFSADGKLLAAAHNYYERNTGQQISEVYLWQVDGAKLIRKIDKAYYNMGSMAFSPDGVTLAVPMQDRTILLIKGSTGKESGRLEAGTGSFFQTLVFSPDGRTLAGALSNMMYAGGPVGVPVQPNQTFRVAVWELASGRIREEFAGHQNSIGALAFSPDGRTLASGSYDTTILLWDLTGGGKATAPTVEALEKIWADLTQKEAKAAYRQGILRLLAAPQLTLDFLKKNLTPAKAPSVSSQEIDKLVADLDAEKFAVREKATKTLEQLGPIAADALKKASQGQPNLEQQRRIDTLLEKLARAILSPEEMRAVRAVEVLERMGTPQAREVLQTLSQGASHARLTQDALVALQRLGRN